jgi:hypothetical protein
MERDEHPSPERVRDLFDQLFAELPDSPESEVEKVRGVLVGGEFLVAIENLTTQLYEFDISIGSEARATLAELARITRLAPRYTAPLGL